MKCQSLFSWKNKKNIINLSSAEYAQGVVKVLGLTGLSKLCRPEAAESDTAECGI